MLRPPFFGRHLSLRARTMASFGIMAFLVSGLVAVACYQVARVTLVAQRERGAQRQAYLNARSIRSALAGDPADAAGSLAGAQPSPGGAAILRVRGQWFSSSVSAGRDDVPASLLRVLDEGDAGHQRVATSDGSAVAVGVPIAGTDAAYVEFVPFAEVETSLAGIGRGLAVASVVATLVGILVGRSLAGRVLRPIKRTADAADEIRGGELTRRLEGEDDRDLLPLVRSFNAMVDDLQVRIEREARFAADVTHELRSPLATMDAALSVARRRVSDDAALEALEALEAEVARFQSLIIDLLEIGRAEAGMADLDVEPVDPRELAASVLRSTHRDESVRLGR